MTTPTATTTAQKIGSIFGNDGQVVRVKGTDGSTDNFWAICTRCDGKMTHDDNDSERFDFTDGSAMISKAASAWDYAKFTREDLDAFSPSDLQIAAMECGLAQLAADMAHDPSAADRVREALLFAWAGEALTGFSITYPATGTAPEVVLVAHTARTVRRMVAEGEKDPALYGRRKALASNGMTFAINEDGYIFEI